MRSLAVHFVCNICDLKLADRIFKYERVHMHIFSRSKYLNIEESIHGSVTS